MLWSSNNNLPTVFGSSPNPQTPKTPTKVAGSASEHPNHSILPSGSWFCSQFNQFVVNLTKNSLTPGYGCFPGIPIPGQAELFTPSTISGSVFSKAAANGADQNPQANGVLPEHHSLIPILSPPPSTVPSSILQMN